VGADAPPQGREMCGLFVTVLLGWRKNRTRPTRPNASRRVRWVLAPGLPSR
jgi:hypothetical protein